MLWQQDGATVQAGRAQAASEQSLRMLHTWGTQQGPPATQAGGGVEGRRAIPKCSSPEDASIFFKPLRDADAQSHGGGTGFQLVWLVLRGPLWVMSELLSLSISNLSEMPLLCLDLKDGNLKPFPQAHFASPNFPTDGPPGPLGGTGCAPAA